MKKLFATAALFALVSGAALAQAPALGDEGESCTVYGQARVIVPLTCEFINGRNTLDFGTMERGDEVDIWAAGSGNGSPALLEVEGDENDKISIWVPEGFRMELQKSDDCPECPEYNPDNPDTYIDVTLYSNGSTLKVRESEMLAGFPNTAPGNLYTLGECVNLSPDASGNAAADGAPASLGSDGLGQLYVSIGGIANTSATQQRGNYYGSMTVQFDYCCY